MEPLASGLSPALLPDAQVPGDRTREDSPVTQTAEHREVGPLCSQATPMPPPLEQFVGTVIYRVKRQGN